MELNTLTKDFKTILNKNAGIVGLSFLCLLYLSGCKSTQLEDPTDCSTSTLSLSIQSITDASCNASDGAVTVTATGGEGNYVFSIGGNVAQSATFNQLAAGTYGISVKDAAGCEVQVDATVNNVDGVQITSVNTEEAGCGSSNGLISVTAAEGTPPYRFKLGTGAFQESSLFGNLSPGKYNLIVSDANDCDISQDIQILSGIKLSENVAPIISANCAVAGCHSGSQSPNLSSSSAIISSAARIRVRTANGTMPPAGRPPLTQAQKDAIACWVEDGALNN